MKNHNEMIDRVLERREEYEHTKKSKYKRTISIAVSCLLVSATTVSVYAISSIIKEKNISQVWKSQPVISEEIEFFVGSTTKHGSINIPCFSRF